LLSSKLGRRASTAKQIENEHYNRDDQQGVNQTSAYIQGKTKKPQQKQNRPPHIEFPFPLFFADPYSIYNLE
jgi:hypothetical protein